MGSDVTQLIAVDDLSGAVVDEMKKVALLLLPCAVDFVDLFEPQVASISRNALLKVKHFEVAGGVQEFCKRLRYL